MKQFGSFCILYLFCSIATNLLSQSDVYIFNIKDSNDTIQINNPRLLTAFNNNGTCKDPILLNQDKMTLSCKSQDDNQFDIWSLDLKNNYNHQISQTNANETQIVSQPNTCNYYFIRSDLDENSISNFWYYPFDQTHAGNIILTFDHPVKNLISVSSAELLVLFDISPTQLAFVNLETKKTNIFSSKIGNTIIYRNELTYFIHKTTPYTWYLKAYDRSTRTAKTLLKLPLETELFAQLEDNKWIFGIGSQLYSINLDTDTTWHMINDLTPYGISNIEEMIIDYDRLVITSSTSD